MDRHERIELLRKIQMASFAVVEVNLYLDTHPGDERALEYYARYRDLLHQLMREYAINYGPLTVDAVTSDKCWTWIDHPWPWEKEC